MNTPPYSTSDIKQIFNHYSHNIQNSVIHIDELKNQNYDLESIFQDRYSIILFLPNQDKSNEIGHWVLLSWLDDKNLEYFDSFGNTPPLLVRELAINNKMQLVFSNKRLQSKSSQICGKYCILRMKSLPTPLSQFLLILKENDKLTPDEIVDSLVNVKYKK